MVHIYTNATFLLYFGVAFLLFVVNKAIIAATPCWCFITQMFHLPALDPWYLRDSEDCLHILFSAQPPSHTEFFSIPLFNRLHASPAPCYYLAWDITDSMTSAPESNKCQVMVWNKREMNPYRRRERKEEVRE